MRPEPVCPPVERGGPHVARHALGTGHESHERLKHSTYPVCVCGSGGGGGLTSNDFAALKEERGVFCALIMVEKLAV